MKFTRIGATGCVNGSCPTVYTSDRGTVVVQGHVVRPSDAHVAVPDGESLVEIPRALLIDAVAGLGRRG